MNSLLLKEDIVMLPMGGKLTISPHEALHLPQAIRCAFKWIM